MSEQLGIRSLHAIGVCVNASKCQAAVCAPNIEFRPMVEKCGPSILPPGSFIQVDESRNQVLSGNRRSEYERPIYFVETREGYTCSWCTHSGEELILLPQGSFLPKMRKSLAKSSALL